jgi:hypothetical protein
MIVQIIKKINKLSVFQCRLLKAYNEFGLGWIYDTLKEVSDSPAQMQNALWLQLLEDKAVSPEAFTTSNALE